MEQGALPEEEPATKVCPDCAETVLAAARKCRFCDYRFDLEVPGADVPDEDDGGPLAILKRKPERPTSVPRELARWGVDLADDEHPVGMWVGSVDESAGFLTVTDARLIFVQGGRSRKGTTSTVRARFLSDIVRVEEVRSFLRTALHIEWSDRSTEQIRLAAGDRAAFRTALEAGMSPRGVTVG